MRSGFCSRCHACNRPDCRTRVFRYRIGEKEPVLGVRALDGDGPGGCGRIQLPGVAVVVALADVNALPLRPGLDRQRPILEKVLVGRLAEVTEVDTRGNPRSDDNLDEATTVTTVAVPATPHLRPILPG